MQYLTCDQVHDAAAGFALDILDPARRAEVLAHLEYCTECRDEVAGMQLSAAQLLDISGQDPWGPEAWADDHDIEVRPARRRLRVMLSMAAVVVLLVGTTLGPEIAQSARSTAIPTEQSPLMSNNEAVGSVLIYAGHSPLVEVAVNNLANAREITCELVTTTGTIVKLGSFKLYKGRGAWLGTPHESPQQIASILLLDQAGRQRAEAVLSPSAAE